MAEPGSHRHRFHRNSRAVARLAEHQPDVHEAFWQVHDAAMRPGALDRAAKELIGLALAVSMHCETCTTMHVRDCIRAGCTREQIYEALNVAIAQGDGATMVHAGWAVEAADEYLAGRGRAAGTDPAAGGGA